MEQTVFTIALIIFACVVVATAVISGEKGSSASKSAPATSTPKPAPAPAAKGPGMMSRIKSATNRGGSSNPGPTTAPQPAPQATQPAATTASAPPPPSTGSSAESGEGDTNSLEAKRARLAARRAELERQRNAGGQ